MNKRPQISARQMKQFDRAEIAVYGEEKTELRKRIDFLNQEGVKKIQQLISYLRSKIAPTQGAVLVDKLQRWVNESGKNEKIFWDTVKSEIMKFNSMDFTQLFQLVPENMALIESEIKNMEDLQYISATQGLALNQLATQCVYWIDQDQIETAKECLADMEAWEPKDYDQVKIWLKEQEAQNKETEADVGEFTTGIELCNENPQS